MTAPDQPLETPMRDHVAKVLDLMAAGGAIRIMDIPDDASHASYTFSGDVSLAVVDFVRNTRAPLVDAHPLAAEARLALERDDVAGWIGSLPKAPLAEAVPDSLRKYLRHDGLCGIIGGYGYCTCGLDAALRAIGEPRNG